MLSSSLHNKLLSLTRDFRVSKSEKPDSSDCRVIRICCRTASLLPSESKYDLLYARPRPCPSLEAWHFHFDETTGGMCYIISAVADAPREFCCGDDTHVTSFRDT